ncbi:hypothetical protein STRAU_7251 [Streptomyces aurantiacus JA 4570]|uniref:Uncharacterized protein n=1 Tax=Streptomyces aurantiacus JA 4570 TaxID=1286094 RepID=S3ZMS4_9ACTN|nr:hypothetical protein STRAU_7251 [Streptomyces aurantiacus JA 4570]
MRRRRRPLPPLLRARASSMVRASHARLTRL